MVQRQDIPHYTADEVEAVLREAWQMIEGLDLPEHVQASALVQAASMLGAKTVQMMQPQPVDLSGLRMPGPGRH